MNPETVISLKNELASLKIIAEEQNKLYWSASKASNAADAAVKACENKIAEIAAKEKADFDAKIKAVVTAQFEARPRLPFDRRHRWLTCEERNAICRFIQVGIHPIEVALKMGCTPTTALRYKDVYTWHCDDEPADKNPWSDTNILSQKS